MDELVEKVREALAAEYPGAPNGRVRDLPDRRAIRWYTTIGLVDKPLGMRGRTALYGPRHLEQLVAIKRLQAQGRSLAQIQADFTWLSPEGLGEVAQVPEALLADRGELTPELSGRHARFWADAPARSAPPAALHSPPASAASPNAAVPSPSDPAVLPPAPLPSLPASALAPPVPASPTPAALPSPPSFPSPPAPASEPGSARQVTAVPLDGGVILLVPQTVTNSDRAAIAAAAAPLVALLAARGLIDRSSS